MNVADLKELLEELPDDLQIIQKCEKENEKWYCLNDLKIPIADTRDYKEIIKLKAFYATTINNEKEITISESLRLLLEALISDDDCFNSKRPFGNSGWFSELFEQVLINNGYINEKDDYKKREQIAKVIILGCIKHIFDKK